MRTIENIFSLLSSPFPPPVHLSGLIYNALKLSMDMNQRLFDECVQKYEAQRQKEKDALKQREDKWNKVQNMAGGAQDLAQAAVQG